MAEEALTGSSLVPLRPNSFPKLTDFKTFQDTSIQILSARRRGRQAVARGASSPERNNKLANAVAQLQDFTYDKSVKETACAFGNLGANAGLGDPEPALETCERPAKLDTNDLGLFWAGWMDLGDIREDHGQFSAALSNYREAEAIADQLVKSDPGNTCWQFALSASHDKIGDVLEDQGHIADALKSYQASLEIREALAKSDPRNNLWQRDLSLSYDKVGDVLVAQEQLSAALKSYHAAFSIRDRLAKATPSNANGQRGLAVSYSKLALVYFKGNQLPEARQNINVARAIAIRLVKAHPEVVQFKNDVDWFDQQIAALK
jgi:tetratricopeptide (TPR) repeat protein